jgi:putative endonuclease
VNEPCYWVYILQCENNAYYSGYTTDIKRRFQEHLLGSAKCKYTRSFKPLGIAQCWQVSGTKSLAMTVERYIKKMTKKEKTAVIKDPDLLSQHFGPEIIRVDDTANFLV